MDLMVHLKYDLQHRYSLFTLALSMHLNNLESTRLSKKNLYFKLTLNSSRIIQKSSQFRCVHVAYRHLCFRIIQINLDLPAVLLLRLNASQLIVAIHAVSLQIACSSLQSFENQILPFHSQIIDHNLIHKIPPKHQLVY